MREGEIHNSEGSLKENRVTSLFRTIIGTEHLFKISDLMETDYYKKREMEFVRDREWFEIIGENGAGCHGSKLPH